MAMRVVIAGGGVAALEAALALRALAEDRVSVELLAPEPQFWYRPLAVAEPFNLGEVRRFELSELAGAAGATFSQGALTGVDAGSKLAQTSAGSVVPYDVLLVACGAVPTIVTVFVTVFVPPQAARAPATRSPHARPAPSRGRVRPRTTTRAYADEHVLNTHSAYSRCWRPVQEKKKSRAPMLSHRSPESSPR